MTDVLIEQLRYGKDVESWWELCGRAADRIEALEENIVELWHESEAGRKPLEHYLGMTWDEYVVWANPQAHSDKVALPDNQS